MTEYGVFKKFLLFDLDGTLTDPKVGICTCVQHALAFFGIEEPDLDKLEPFIGPPLKDSFIKYYHFTEEQADVAIEKYRERFADVGLFENELYEGVVPMLRSLSAAGMVLAVASSKPTVYVQRILEHFKIARYFKVVVGSELDGRRVNKDEVVQEALRQLFGENKVEPEQVYMIGDRCFDVEGAHRAGIESVGVTYGYGSMEELKNARADYIVRSVEELRQFLLRETKTPASRTGIQKTWYLLYSFLLFILVKRAAMYLLQLCVLMLGSVGLGANYLILYNAEGVPEQLTGNAAAIMSALSFAAAAVAVMGRAKREIDETAEEVKLLHMKREPRKSYVLLAAAVAGMVFGVSFLLSLTGITGSSGAYRSVAMQQFSASLLIGLICYGVVGPVAEELLFRGIIYGSLRRSLKPSLAIVFSALLFGVYHGNIVQGIYAFVMGCLIAYAYEYFGSFKIALGIHIVANVASYCFSYVVPELSEIAEILVCVPCLACAGISVCLLNKAKRIV